MSIVSHLGLNGKASFPSYTTIAREAGIGRNAIRRALDILVEYGFIKIFAYREGKKDRNMYFIQDAAYNSGLMNKFATNYRTFNASCRRCGAGMDRGGYGLGPTGANHFGCGGSVKIWTKDEKFQQVSTMSYKS